MKFRFSMWEVVKKQSKEIFWLEHQLIIVYWSPDLKKFSDDEQLLKKLAFNEGSIIDFYSARDFTDLEFEKPKREVKDKNDDYFSLLNQGVI